MSTVNSPVVTPRASVNIPRSVNGISNQRLMTMSSGYLYPIYVEQVLPGDSCRMDMSFLMRMNTPIHPTMGDAYADVAFFFVPNRIIFDKFKELMGESPEDPYLNPVEYQLPVLNGSTGDDHIPIPPKSLLDYLGMPAGNSFEEVNQLPVRAFCFVWNTWWRDQNLQYAIDYPTDDTSVFISQSGAVLGSDLGWSDDAMAYYNGNNDDFYIESTGKGGVLPPVNKFHDLFTSATLQAQKGDPVPIPVSSFSSDWLPVMTRSDYVYKTDDQSEDWEKVEAANPLRFGSREGSSAGYVYDEGGGTAYFVNGSLHMANSSPSDGYMDNGVPLNLWADLRAASAAEAYATINDLHYAFCLQSFLRADNLYGTRYRELIYGHFKVLSPDASLQIPEFLGGATFNINVQPVVQTSGTTDTSPQGNLAAYSMTSGRKSYFSKSFTEFGVLIGVACVRTIPAYQQGIPKWMLYKDKLDFYFPEFANLPDQPIKVQELYNTTGQGSVELEYWDKYFGFAEAWYELRTKNNEVCGEFRSNYPTSLDYWHYAEYFAQQPILSDGFIRQKRDVIDRTLAAASDSFTDQFLCEFYFTGTWTRPLPIYSMSGVGLRL